MGYILPVANYQYSHYQNRTIKKKHDPYPIQKVYQAQFKMAYYKAIKQPFQRNNELNQTNMQFYQEVDTIEEQNSRLTGLGKYINVKI